MDRKPLIVPPHDFTFTGERIDIDGLGVHKLSTPPTHERSLPMQVLVRQSMLMALMDKPGLLNRNGATQSDFSLKIPFTSPALQDWVLHLLPSPDKEQFPTDFLGLLAGEGVLKCLQGGRVLQMQRKTLDDAGLALTHSAVLRVSTPDWCWENPQGTI